MNLFRKVKNKFQIWFRKKEEKKLESVMFVEKQKINTVTTDELEKQFKKLNSRVSLMTQKIEEMQKQQNQMLTFIEQILFHASGSFDSEESLEEEISFEKDENNITAMKIPPYKLN